MAALGIRDQLAQSAAPLVGQDSPPVLVLGTACRQGHHLDIRELAEWERAVHSAEVVVELDLQTADHPLRAPQHLDLDRVEAVEGRHMEPAVPAVPAVPEVKACLSLSGDREWQIMRSS